MYRWTTLILGLMLAAALSTILFTVPRSSALPSQPAASSSAAPIESATPAIAPDPSAAAMTTAEGEPTEELVPLGPLPASAPKRVTFGVVLVRYTGAEGATATARSKADAKRFAEALIPEAAADFAAAVQRGDRGSTTNAGQLPQDVLEPALEHALFTLKPGQVHPQPVDSPRGFWIIKRVK